MRRYQSLMPFAGLLVLASLVAMLAGVGGVQSADGDTESRDLVDAPAFLTAHEH